MSGAFDRRFNAYSTYLQEKYGVKTYRVSVDAGFSCPNRRHGRSGTGCTFCDVDGSRAPYLDSEFDLPRQISEAIAYLSRRYGASAFTLYFQAYSGTFGSVPELRSIYDRGLSEHEFLELIVSTRPDCVDEARADLLASYKRRVRDVWVELGLQTPNDEALRRVHRGHGVAEFENACAMLRRRGIKVGVHLMFGLPGEDFADVSKTAEYIARLHPDGVKIHNLRIVDRTPLFREALKGEVPLLGWRRYVEYLCAFLARIPKDVVVLRLGFDPPPGRAALPTSFRDKAELLRALTARMEELRIRQGSEFAADHVSSPSSRQS